MIMQNGDGNNKVSLFSVFVFVLLLLFCFVLHDCTQIVHNVHYFRLL